MLGMPTGPSCCFRYRGSPYTSSFFLHQVIKHTNMDIDFTLLFSLIIRLKTSISGLDILNECRGLAIVPKYSGHAM